MDVEQLKQDVREGRVDALRLVEIVVTLMQATREPSFLSLWGCSQLSSKVLREFAR